MINPKKIKAGDFFYNENKLFYLYLGMNTLYRFAYRAGEYEFDFINENPDEVVYGFIVNNEFMWVRLTEKDWLKKFTRVGQ